MNEAPRTKKRQTMFTHGQPTYKTDTGEEEARLKELMLYISQKCADDPNFGATKLNKILWLADSMAFARSGKPLTGVAYMNQKAGPVPRVLRRVRGDMEETREMAIERRPKGKFFLERTVALRDPNLDLFSAKDISFVDDLIKILWDHDGTQLSGFSHSCNIGWKLTKTGEDIPYEAFMISDNELTPGMVKRIHECNAEYGWESSAQCNRN